MSTPQLVFGTSGGAVERSAVRNRGGEGLADRGAHHVGLDGPVPAPALAVSGRAPGVIGGRVRGRHGDGPGTVVRDQAATTESLLPCRAGCRGRLGVRAVVGTRRSGDSLVAGEARGACCARRTRGACRAGGTRRSGRTGRARGTDRARRTRRPGSTSRAGGTRRARSTYGSRSTGRARQTGCTSDSCGPRRTVRAVRAVRAVR